MKTTNKFRWYGQFYCNIVEQDLCTENIEKWTEQDKNKGTTVTRNIIEMTETV